MKYLPTVCSDFNQATGGGFPVGELTIFQFRSDNSDLALFLLLSIVKPAQVVHVVDLCGDLSSKAAVKLGLPSAGTSFFNPPAHSVFPHVINHLRTGRKPELLIINDSSRLPNADVADYRRLVAICQAAGTALVLLAIDHNINLSGGSPGRFPVQSSQTMRSARAIQRLCLSSQLVVDVSAGNLMSGSDSYLFLARPTRPASPTSVSLNLASVPGDLRSRPMYKPSSVLGRTKDKSVGVLSASGRTVSSSEDKEHNHPLKAPGASYGGSVPLHVDPLKMSEQLSEQTPVVDVTLNRPPVSVVAGAFKCAECSKSLPLSEASSQFTVVKVCKACCGSDARTAVGIPSASVSDVSCVNCGSSKVSPVSATQESPTKDGFQTMYRCGKCHRQFKVESESSPTRQSEVTPAREIRGMKVEGTPDNPTVGTQAMSAPGESMSAAASVVPRMSKIKDNREDNQRFKVSADQVVAATMPTTGKVMSGDNVVDASSTPSRSMGDLKVPRVALSTADRISKHGSNDTYPGGIRMRVEVGSVGDLRDASISVKRTASGPGVLDASAVVSDVPPNSLGVAPVPEVSVPVAPAAAVVPAVVITSAPKAEPAPSVAAEAPPEAPAKRGRGRYARR